MPSLSATFGRGAATIFQEDLQNSDCILIMGSNMAEAHPVGFRFVMKARERGREDHPRRPAFQPHVGLRHRLRADPHGHDIVFLGGIINQILQQERWFKEYVLPYTNATTIINDELHGRRGQRRHLLRVSTPRDALRPGQSQLALRGRAGAAADADRLRHIGARSCSQTLAQLSRTASPSATRPCSTPTAS